MSHFSCLVIGDDVDAQLQPYHEYECTGINDEYVIDVDVTDEVNALMATPFEVVRLADGTLHAGYSNEFYTTQNEFILPDGAEVITVPRTEAAAAGLTDATFEGIARAEFDANVRDGRAYRRTNPNNKWDWWQIGGRWANFFLLKRGQGYADSALKGRIDFTGMRIDAVSKASAHWREVRVATGGLGWTSFDDLKVKFGINQNGPFDEVREAYWSQPALAILTEHPKLIGYYIDDDLGLDEEIYVQRKRERVGVTYAFVRDGTWTERGQMGWFGISSGDMPRAEWNKKFAEMIDGLPDDTLLTIVDCHS